MLAKSISISAEDRKRMGGNAQMLFRFPPEWLEAMERVAIKDEDAQTLVKALIHPVLSQVVTVERDDKGNVLAFSGHDADGKKVTIRCDGKPAVKGAKPLPTAPTRGRPRKPREPGDE